MAEQKNTKNTQAPKAAPKEEPKRAGTADGNTGSWVPGVVTEGSLTLTHR